MEQDDLQPEAKPSEPYKDRSKDRVLKAGQSFGNYRVIRCICAGLLANYYLMQHVRDLHEVTVVIFHPKTNGDQAFYRRLRELYARMKKFKYERFPKIQECVFIQNRYCLFLAPVEGISLTNYLNENGVPGKSGIGPDRTTRILAQLHGALGYAHTEGFDHRDLCSDLIFINEKGNIQILGLGFRSAVGIELFEVIVSASISPILSEKVTSHLTSFDILSPEYRMGVKEDARVDIFAVGMIGYWLLTGIKPEPSKLKLASELVEFLPTNWDRFFKRSLEKDRDERYPSCKVALLGLKEADPEIESDRAHFVQRHIDRIPVPKGIRQRGKAATSVYRLAIIGFIGVSLIGLAGSVINSLFSAKPGTLDSVAQRVEQGEEANLILRVEPSRASVRVVGTSDSFIVSKGELNLLIRPGGHKLKIAAPEHKSKQVSVSVLKDELTRKAVILEPAWAEIKIQTEPEAELFFLNDAGAEIKIGQSDDEGNYTLKKVLDKNDYNVVLKKVGFEPYVISDEEFKLGEQTVIEAKMELLPSVVEIQSNPSGASVLVNDVLVGNTPIEELGLVPNVEHSILVELEGYRSSVQEVQLAANENKLLDFGDLILRSGSLEFDFSFLGKQLDTYEELLADIEIRVDGEVYGLDSQELESVSEGLREVEVLHPFYISKQTSVSILDRETKRLSIELSPKPGVVRIDLPAGLKPEVFLNGEQIRLNQNKIEIPSSEKVNLELQIRDYLTLKRVVNLEPGRTLEWSVVPTPIPSPALGKNWTVPYVGLSCQWVPSGSYAMGSPLEEHGRLPNEGPLTAVRLSEGFWVATFETTQQQYTAIMESNPAAIQGPRKPVDSVTWSEAKEFCQKLNEIEAKANRLPEGYMYRLPTEAEWEYAARAQSGSPFFFGDQADVTNGNFRGVYPLGWEEGKPSANFYGTREVGSYPPNDFGLYDMHGNISEWTLDRYNGRLRGGSVSDPLPYAEGKEISLRGGSWEDNAKRVRSAARRGVSPKTESNSIGFRVVLAPEL
ncbi:MAG: SUMF1/EgtB/PvdO family nonheme iron enzyme [Verrucomicrobiota bacterium]